MLTVSFVNPVLCLLALVSDWPAVAQRPFESRKIEATPLPPLMAHGEPVATREDWERSRHALRSRWMAILGKFPEIPKSLSVAVHSREDLGRFSREVVSFETEGGDRLRAALLSPPRKDEGKLAAVVVFHETTPLTYRQPAGLAGDSDRHFGVELVRRGYVVLCPECFILKPPTDALSPINVAKAQAAALAMRRPCWTGMGKLTFDASRCVDYLESLSFVDKGRVGCLGFSLGAKEVLYAMAFEPRFRAGVATEGGVGIRMSNWADDWYLGPTINDRLATFDHHQLLALAAPRAVLIQGGGSADGEKSWPYVAAALPIYRLLGAADRIGLYDHKGKHSFPKAAREVAYRWLDDWLGHKPMARSN